MSELASAMFSIADANEFRFARFYIVCEEVALAPLKSPPIVCGLSDTPCGLSKRGKDTELDTGRGMEETLEFCFKECYRRLHSGTSYHALPEIISHKYSAGIPAS